MIPAKYPWVQNPYDPQIGLQVPDSEIQELKREIQELKKLIEAAKQFDAATGQPDCETETKTKKLKLIFELVREELNL